MKKIIAIIMGLFFIQGCEAQSRMPQEMPERVRISLTESGGMMRAYKKIEIEEGLLEIEELKSGQQDPQKRTIKISREDLSGLYQVFAASKFDTIKNDERAGIVHDAGSERITISFDPAKFFGVTSGRNTPLSGQNLQRYQSVRKAIDDLVARAQNKPDDNAVNESEMEKFIHGKWRVEGQNGGYGWFLEWTFDQGTFRQTGYPSLIQEGKYKVLSVTENKLTLDLFDQKGTFGTEKRRLEIIVDKENFQLTISGTKGFSKLTDEKK
jgi:predicted DNA-binding protein